MALRRFNWRSAVIWFSVAFAACWTGSYYSYSYPFTSAAWHLWVLDQCGTPSGAPNGVFRGVAVDVLRALLAAMLSLFTLYRLRAIPSPGSSTEGERVERLGLNWMPVFGYTRRPSGVNQKSSFELTFGYEKWILVGFAILAAWVIGVSRPLEFLLETSHGGSVAGGLLGQIRALYTTSFWNITRPYLFPYSLYVLGLWYFMALPILLILMRSIRRDVLAYSQAFGALEAASRPGYSLVMKNVVAIYERKVQRTFAIIDEIGKRYAHFLVASIALSYIQLKGFSCSVLPGARETGKELLLLLTITSIGSLLYLFLRMHYDARRAAKVGINAISDRLERIEKRRGELREATALAVAIQRRDGVRDLLVALRGFGFASIIFGVFWKVVLRHRYCDLAQAMVPDPIITLVGRIIRWSCSVAQ